MASCHVCGNRYNHNRTYEEAQVTKCRTCGDQSCSEACGERCCAGLYSYGSLSEEKVAVVVAQRDAYRKAIEEALSVFYDTDNGAVQILQRQKAKNILADALKEEPPAQGGSND